MTRLEHPPFRYRWMRGTTILAAVSAVGCFIGQMIRAGVNAQYGAPASYAVNSPFNRTFTFWMMIPVFSAFVSILLFLAVAVREQYALTRFGGVLLYGLTASAIVLPAACYVGVMVNANYTALAAVLYTLPFLMTVVLFLTLLALRLARRKKPASIMLSPWVGIPGYLTLFVLCFGPFAAGDYGVSAPGGPAETWLMTASLALTVLFMGMDTVLYRRALRRRPNDA